MATQPFFLCLKIVVPFSAKGPGFFLTPHSYFILYNTFKETLFLAFIFKGLRAHLVLFFIKKVPLAIFLGSLKSLKSLSGSPNLFISEECKIGSLCRNDEYRSGEEHFQNLSLLHTHWE